MESTEKQAHEKAKKPVSEKEKEVLENIMDELEKEAQEKEETVAKTSEAEAACRENALEIQSNEKCRLGFSLVPTVTE